MSQDRWRRDPPIQNLPGRSEFARILSREVLGDKPVFADADWKALAEIVKRFMQKAPKMKPTRLIQRLSSLHPTLSPAAANAFSFGGGLRFGGLSEEAMNLIGKLFKFDYMGSAQYEHGALPEALNRMANTRDLEVYPVTVPLAEIALGPCPFLDLPDLKKGTTHETFWVVCSARGSEEVVRRVSVLARYASSDHVECQAAGIYLRDNFFLDRFLKAVRSESGETIGGLELDNGFLISLDEEMAKGFLQIFQPEAGA